MAYEYKNTDFFFSANEDFISHNGDLVDTAFDDYQSLRQDLRTLVGSIVGDWRHMPTFSAAIDGFLGQGMTTDKIAMVSQQVKQSIVINLDIPPEKIYCRAFPLPDNSLGIYVNILRLPSETEGQDINVKDLFLVKEHGVEMRPHIIAVT